jgi:hypothetical protein
MATATSLKIYGRSITRRGASPEAIRKAARRITIDAIHRTAAFDPHAFPSERHDLDSRKM